MAGGMCGRRGMHGGVCMARRACGAGGHAWQGLCVAEGGLQAEGGMHGRGHAWHTPPEQND